MLTLPKWAGLAGIVLAGLFLVLWLGQCFTQDQGDGMSDSTRARLEQLEDSAQSFRDFQEAVTIQNARRDSAVTLLLVRANDAESRAERSIARMGQAERMIQVLHVELAAATNPGDSIRTLSELTRQQDAVIQTQNKIIVDLQVTVQNLRPVIAARDSALKDAEAGRAAALQRLASTEEAVRLLRVDLERATECRVNLGLFGFKCPSRRVVSVVSFGLGVGLTLVGAAAVK